MVRQHGKRHETKGEGTFILSPNMTEGRSSDHDHEIFLVRANDDEY